MAVLVSAWLILALPQVRELEAAGYARREIPTGPLFLDRGSLGREAWAREVVPRGLRAVERKLGRELGREFTTVLVFGAAELRRAIRPQEIERAESTLGVAVPRRGLLAVRTDISYSERPEDPAFQTLFHEIAHLVVHRKPSVEIPRWLDEGVAMWAAGTVLTAREEAHLALLARAGGLYRFESLDRAFPREHEPSAIAYQQSLLFVEFLVARAGKDAVGRLLDAIEGGEDSWKALGQLIGREREAWAVEFVEWVSARRSWMEILLHLVNLWTIAGILAVIAILRYVFRRRRLLRDMERREASEASESPPVETPF
jgi:hypothetical protein